MRLDLGVVQGDGPFDWPDPQRADPSFPDIQQFFQPDRIQRDIVQTIDDLCPVVASDQFRRCVAKLLFPHGAFLPQGKAPGKPSWGADLGMPPFPPAHRGLSWQGKMKEAVP
jgi:hypothetical protein